MLNDIILISFTFHTCTGKTLLLVLGFRIKRLTQKTGKYVLAKYKMCPCSPSNVSEFDRYANEGEKVHWRVKAYYKSRLKL